MSKTAGHTAADPAMEAAIAIQREFVHAVASADAQEAKDCEARWRVRIAATIRMAYMPLDASNLRKVEALRDALRRIITLAAYMSGNQTCRKIEAIATAALHGDTCPSCGKPHASTLAEACNIACSDPWHERALALDEEQL